MKNKYDYFPPNFLEMLGPIPRTPFKFRAEKALIWRNGEIIDEIEGPINFISTIEPFTNFLHANFIEDKLHHYIRKSFFFPEISYSGDRILWSKNILNNFEGVEPFEPETMSLFYKDGELSKIYLNVLRPYEILIELVGRKELEDNINTESSINLEDFHFLSDNHIRIERGMRKKDNKGSWREIIIRSLDNETFLVSILNKMEINPWRNNVQMVGKVMKIIEETENKIVLKGVNGLDIFGNNYSNYGLTICKNKYNEIEKITLHIFSRDIDIIYLKGNKEEYEKFKKSQHRT